MKSMRIPFSFFWMSETFCFCFSWTISCSTLSLACTHSALQSLDNSEKREKIFVKIGNRDGGFLKKKKKKEFWKMSGQIDPVCNQRYRQHNFITVEKLINTNLFAQLPRFRATVLLSVRWLAAGTWFSARTLAVWSRTAVATAVRSPAAIPVPAPWPWTRSGTRASAVSTATSRSANIICPF